MLFQECAFIPFKRFALAHGTLWLATHIGSKCICHGIFGRSSLLLELFWLLGSKLSNFPISLRDVTPGCLAHPGSAGSVVHDLSDRDSKIVNLNDPLES